MDAGPVAMVRTTGRELGGVMGRTGILIIAVITTGLTAGVFVDWSNAVMPGLREVGDRTFVETFQALDAAIVNPLFLGGGFLGSLLLIGLSAVLHLGAERRTALIWIGAALVCWLAMFAITFGVHEPLNQQLRTAEPLGSGADFAAARALLDEAKWTAWNTVRALVSVMASGCLLGALVSQRQLADNAGQRPR